ncbi:2-phospho-L-lactate guanylyltransferase [Streptomyces sp. NPDC007088]|uniref:2-phospho-L-lactate guanylyltransferase n=1 Tax=Streptomyces sp. NPDC007088 TaxID=3364773 RepID=UPI003699FFEC
MTAMHTPPEPAADLLWTLVVPLKPLPRAKTRLAADVPAPLRERLALAFAQDTVAVALSCPEVLDVVVVTDDADAAGALRSLGAGILADRPGGGLNAALSYGAEEARRTRPRAPVAALNADLPALRVTELSRVLRNAGHFSRSFLADAAETGTTFLAAGPETELRPLFGGRSRFRHRASGARELELPDVPSARQDVDTADDLRAALALGVGPFTRRVTERLQDRGGPAGADDLPKDDGADCPAGA